MFILDMSIEPSSTNPYGATTSGSTVVTPNLPTLPNVPGATDSFGRANPNARTTARLQAHQTGHSAGAAVSGVGSGLLLMALFGAMKAAPGAALLGPWGIGILAVMVAFTAYSAYNQTNNTGPTDGEITGRLISGMVNNGTITTEQRDLIVRHAGDRTRLRTELVASGLTGDDINQIFSELDNAQATRGQAPTTGGQIGWAIGGAAILGLMTAFTPVFPLALLIGALIGMNIRNIGATATPNAGDFFAGLTGRQTGIEAYAPIGSPASSPVGTA